MIDSTTTATATKPEDNRDMHSMSEFDCDDLDIKSQFEKSEPILFDREEGEGIS